MQKVQSDGANASVCITHSNGYLHVCMYVCVYFTIFTYVCSPA